MALKFNFNTGYAQKEETSLSDIEQYFRKQTRTIDEILVWATEHQCSDVFIKVLERPFISRFGKIFELPCSPITKDAWAVFYDKNVLNELNAQYVRNKLLDISIEVRIPDDSEYFGQYDSNYYRYRANFGFSEDKNICTFRMIRPSKPTFDTINYPADCEAMLHEQFSKRSGIILFTGPTGSGKSTSMAACFNTYTQKNDVLDNKVIITLEDPIENSFSSTSSVKINQKELNRDFKTFALGVKSAVREHPNIILVGECRDKEVICATLDACKTGHFTVTTYHAFDVAGTASRMLYHLDNDKNLAYDLIINLNAIVSQRLVPSDNGYIVDVQYMVFDDYVKKQLIHAIDNDLNVAVEISHLMKNQELQQNGIVKDWSY